jgi:hypothetical protein
MKKWSPARRQPVGARFCRISNNSTTLGVAAKNTSAENRE